MFQIQMIQEGPTMPAAELNHVADVPSQQGGPGEQRNEGNRRGRQTRWNKKEHKKKTQEEDGRRSKRGRPCCRQKEEEAQEYEKIPQKKGKWCHLRSISALTLGSSSRDPAATALPVSVSASVSESLSVTRSILKLSMVHKRPITPAATTMFPNVLPKNLQFGSLCISIRTLNSKLADAAQHSMLLAQRKQSWLQCSNTDVDHVSVMITKAMVLPLHPQPTPPPPLYGPKPC